MVGNHFPIDGQNILLLRYFVEYIWERSIDGSHIQKCYDTYVRPGTLCTIHHTNVVLIDNKDDLIQ